MARNITLWVNNQRVDMNDDSLIQFNYQQTDLNNPAVVRNSYSHTVTLPATDVNNRIFGSYFRLDRMTGATGFNPMVRTPFSIFDDTNTLLQSGYLKLDKVTRKDGGIYSYSVSLYGGLGGFFYQLSATDEGEPLNLGDLLYVSPNYSVRPNAEDAVMSLQSGTVSDAWREACGLDKSFPSLSLWTFFLQFAPCYNGIPENFDAKKVLVNASANSSVRDYNAIQLRSGEYSHKDVTSGTVLVTMATDKDEWEMRDFRAYLQRPVLSVREVFRAIPYTISDYRFSWSNGVNVIIQDLWLTLVQPKRTGDYSQYPMRNIFEKSISPAQLLIDIAKTFGFVFRMTGRNEIEVFTREEYYNAGETIDLARRIDRSKDITIAPYAFDAKFYVWKNDVAEGGYAREYKDRYDKDYGQLRVNTNYQFSDSTKEVLDKLAIRSGVMSVKASQLMRFTAPYNGFILPTNDFIPSLYENVTYQYFQSDGVTPGGDTRVMLYPAGVAGSSYWYNPSHPLYDIAERLQLEDDGKPIDGANILLCKQGYDITPYPLWRITNDDTTAFNALNEGVPCWDQRRSGGGILVERIPRYSRYYSSYGQKSLDFGYPMETSIPWLNVENYTPIYNWRWSRYFADRMDKDTRVLRCWVDMKGLQVGQDLMRNLYYYANSLWCLTKVENYVIGRVGTTQCEFVKVQDIDNYKTE